ncbi:MAG: glycosyltransferase [Planctomycetes bacterium]|nr:glycosyltransferase [Planctomycetota bacterium]
MTDGISTPPVVSVAMLTFNHERFIRQAVESVLCQKTDFEFEIVISDDSSTDATPEILRELQESSAGQIRLLNHNSRLGVNRNLLETLKACRGNYIALLEGDDFWLGEEKLATQIAFLESHPDCSSVHHNVFRQADDDVDSRSLMHLRSPGSMSLREVLRTNPVATCSVMFRNEFSNGVPDWLLEVAMPDWCLHVLNAKRGQLGYIDQAWAV